MALEAAYVAGFFDGEGCITLTTNSEGSVYLHIALVNSDGEVLSELKKEFGGKIYEMKKVRFNHKQVYSWRLQSGDAIKFLQKIIPWLRIKREQALIAFEWNSIRTGRGAHNRYEPLDVFMKRRTIMLEMKERISKLNHSSTDYVQPITSNVELEELF